MIRQDRFFLSTGMVLAALGMMTLPTEAGRIVGLAACSGGGPDCTPPPPNSGFVAVSSGNYHGMGLRPDGSIATWGLCDVEQCDVPLPNSGYIAISAGDSHSLALRPGGMIVAWGSNEAGQLNVPAPNSGFVAIAAGGLHSLALRSDGSIAGWGSSPGSTVTPPAPNTGFVAIAAGGWRSMGLKSDGSIVMWGCGTPCELPAPNTGFVAISTHHTHALAVRSDGSIVAWGSNNWGQHDVPAPNTGFVAVAAGDQFDIGLKANGSVAIWGRYEQSTVPLPNAGFDQVTANTGFAYGLRSQVTFKEHLVSTNANFSTSVVAADVDGDGDTDAVTAEYEHNTLGWYENNGATPPGWTKRFVDNGGALGPVSVATGDVDGDGDADVFSANLNEEGVVFYENRGATWVKTALTGGMGLGMHVADVDGDGDLDGIGGLGQSPGVEWYENKGTVPPTFTVRAISAGAVGAQAVHAADLDGDGDTDILATDTSNDRVLWFANSGAHPPTWTQRVVATGVDDPYSVFSADLDGDGDVDVLSASIGLIAWHQNNGASPPVFTTRTIASGCNAAVGVHAADLDGDGDRDVIAGCTSAVLSWFESSGGSSPAFNEHAVGSCASPVGIFAARVDADADIDILCSSNAPSGKVHFFENNGSGMGSCTADADCSDGQFCNGVEDCVAGQCQPGTKPCAQECRESDDQCVQCLHAGSCIDGQFCNGDEACSAAGSCQAGTPIACAPPLFCSEIFDSCVQGTQSAAGRVGGSSLRLQKAGANLTLTWGASCLGTDTDYAVYEGTVGGTFTSHASRLCGTSGLTTATFASAAGSTYYLIVPRNSAREGSYGTRTGGIERPVGLGECAAQLLGSCQ
jgi:alpha-tubulin suppressor-like RCC1 family protein